jgi:SAM-dependent methyltransferase
MDNKPIALDAYETLAARYAAKIDTKPHNAYYERPATLSLLPEVQGLRVLDAGCGTGLYAEWLLDRGAAVVGVDVSPAMLSYARKRVGDRCDLHLADLSRPLDFLADGAFDLVFSSLALHYIEDWHAPLAEFHRVLRDGGLFVFSIEHPSSDLKRWGSENYFAVEHLTIPWHSFGGEPVPVPFFRRSLGAVSEALWDTGFVIERLVEPQPTEAFWQADPKHAAEVAHWPGFLCVRARRV